jgi:hypothetical protein
MDAEAAGHDGDIGRLAAGQPREVLAGLRAARLGHLVHAQLEVGVDAAEREQKR